MGFLVVALFTLALGLVMVGSVWGVNVAMARLIGSKHQALQTIVETGQVPLGWRKPFDKKLARLAQDPSRAQAQADLRARATARYLERLDELVRYAETTTLIDGDDARAMILGKLAEARVAWQGSAGAQAAECGR